MRPQAGGAIGGQGLSLSVQMGEDAILCRSSQASHKSEVRLGVAPSDNVKSEVTLTTCEIAAGSLKASVILQGISSQL